MLNIKLAAMHLAADSFTVKPLKEALIQGLNNAQSTTIKTLKDNLYLEFDNPALVNYLVKKTVFSVDEVARGKHLLNTPEREEVAKNIQKAQTLIKSLDPYLYQLITELIGSVAVYHIPNRDGGTVSCCLGLIWLSPTPEWKIEYYTEMLVHEFVHNSIFLDDMVNGIMPNIDLLDREDTLVTSAIRKTLRGYDKSFHSACVASSLMYYYHLLDNNNQAESYANPILKTLDELEQRDTELQRKGHTILTNNGRNIVREIRHFVEHRDYNAVAQGLQ